MDNKRMRKAKQRCQNVKLDTLIGQGFAVDGNIRFKGGLHVDGIVRGDVNAEDGVDNVLIISVLGVIEGVVQVPNVVLNGTVVGDVYASEHIELATNARITGNVYYNLIEMAIGAEVNGRLIHESERELVATPKLVAPLKSSVAKRIPQKDSSHTKPKSSSDPEKFD